MSPSKESPENRMVAAIRLLEKKHGLRIGSDGCGCCGDGGSFTVGGKTVFRDDAGEVKALE